MLEKIFALGPIIIETTGIPKEQKRIWYMITVHSGKDSFRTNFETSSEDPIQSVVYHVLTDLEEAGERQWARDFIEDTVYNRGLDERSAWILYGFGRRNRSEIARAINILEHRYRNL